MMKITGIPAFSDNYLWALENETHLALVDPGDAATVLAYLEKSGKKLCAILVTHHHADHIGGIQEVLAHTQVPVFGPAAERSKITMLTHALSDGDKVKLPGLDLEFEVLDVGGHTLGHIAYFNPAENLLFCGDTLFAGGCGRVFEGTLAQMWHSLAKLAALPADTHVYCAHEYTASNLKFALAVEPGNAALQARNADVLQKRAANQATVPSRLSDELASNPFLRWSSPEVIAAARTHTGNAALQTPIEIFSAIREWKNNF